MNLKLSDLGYEIKDSCVPDKNQVVPYIGLEHVQQDSLHLGTHGFSSEVQSTKFRFKQGDILFGTLRPYFRKLIIVPFDGISSTEFSVIRTFDPGDLKFLFYVMAQQEFIDFATTNSNGARPRTKWDLFSGFKITNHDSRSRKKIGNILSAYDDLIENNNRRIELLEESARLLYREWFVKLRFPGHENTRITDGVPEGWEEYKIKDLV